MNWAWASSLDQLWSSASFPMWITLAAAGFFGIIVLITLLRAEKSVANGALTVITLLAVGITVAATIRGYGPAGRTAQGEIRLASPAGPASPVLSRVRGFSGEGGLSPCPQGPCAVP